MEHIKGFVEHQKSYHTTDFGLAQVDKFITRIPFSAMEEEALNTLNNWAVEDYDCSYIDWDNEEIVSTYRTLHYLPQGYEPEDLED